MTVQVEADFREWAARFAEFYVPGSRSEKEFRLTIKLVMAARRWTTQADEYVQRKTGHSRARWQTLSALAFSDGPVATLELARRLAIRWPTLIRILKELDEAGLISRRTDPGDKRSRLVAITPEGRRVMLRVQDVLDPLRSRALASFSDEDLVRTEAVLTRLFTVLTHDLQPEA
jgi:MarR family transcriptional regulator for hemolysin